MLTEQQQRSLDLLDKYLKETPKEEIQVGIDAVSKLKFAGPTVKEYFDNFHTAFSFGFPEKEYVFNEIKKEEIAKEQVPLFSFFSTKSEELLIVTKRKIARYNPISSKHLRNNQYHYV